MSTKLKEKEYESPNCVGVLIAPLSPIAGSNEQIVDDEEEYGWD